MMMDKVVYFN